jgi:hypothetical protein
MLYNIMAPAMAVVITELAMDWRNGYGWYGIGGRTVGGICPKRGRPENSSSSDVARMRRQGTIKTSCLWRDACYPNVGFLSGTGATGSGI